MEHVLACGNQTLLKIWFSAFLCITPFTLSAEINVKNSNKVIKAYDRYHKRYSQRVCRPGTEEKFNKLYQDYLSYGFYIPLKDGGKVDVDTIKENLSLVKDKIRFIQSNIHFLKNDYDSSKSKLLLNRLKLDLREVAKTKTDYRMGPIEANKKRSLEAIEKLGRNFISLLDSVPFLLSFMFPVDYFELRYQYDDPKNRKQIDLKNKIYFIRKIVEDGAQEKNVGRSDKFFRAMVSTVYLRLKNQSHIFDDELYYDMKDLLKGFDRQMDYGRDKLIARQQEWLERSGKILEFYKDIVRNYKKHPEKLNEYLSKKKLALAKLRDFVQLKQTQTYLYWMNRPETYRALFSIETILMNEVGRLDVDGDLERKEIVKIIEKRSKMAEYSNPKEDSLLYRKIKRKIKDKYKQYRWLNTLFKEGEFSFTYYFIHASVRTFCPEMTGAGRSLRKENIEIAINGLDSAGETEAIRYFSRASMLGRISMHKIWERFVPMVERPGLLITNKQHLSQRIKRREYHWLYDFKFEDDKFWAIEINNKRYIYEEGAEQFYKYRNPYYFTYFKEKTLN